MVIALAATVTVSASATGRPGAVGPAPPAAAAAQPPAGQAPAPVNGRCQPDAAGRTPLVQAKFDITGVSRIAKVGSDTTIAGTLVACAYIDNGDLTRPLLVSAEVALDDTKGAYFVIFRFVPATSTVSYRQDGTPRGTASLVNFNPNDVDTDLTLSLFIRVSDTLQDRIPVRVGAHCETEVSAAIHFKGIIHPVTGSTSQLSSTFEIPRFNGCGEVEDLDPLITGLIAGPGNDIRTTLVSLGPP